MSIIAGVRAVAGLTVREAIRLHLWLVFVVVAIGLIALVPRLQAVDDAARLKLSVLVVTAATGFVTTLLAVLVGSSALRRDIEARTAYVLFAKPLGRGTYLFGRWLGTQLWLLAGILLLALAGVAAVWLQFRGLPDMRSTLAPTAWNQLSPSGEIVPMDTRRTRIALTGSPGGGVRWQFTGVKAPSGGRDLELLLRAQVSGLSPDIIVREAPVTVRAVTADGHVPLTIDPASPYGHLAGDTNRVLLRDRDPGARDLGQDYLRIRVPPAAIGRDGRLTIETVRLETRSNIILDRSTSALISVDAGGLAGNMLRGGLTVLAAAGLLGAWALFCATVANLGITLLAGLTLFFAGHALGAVRDTLTHENPSLLVRRLLELLQTVLPDFGRFNVAGDLAAGVGIGWAMVGDAWLYHGIYAAVFLAMAWFALARREL